MKQFYKLRSSVRWGVAIVAALLIAAIPTRVSMHYLAVGFPLPWHIRQQGLASGGTHSVTFCVFEQAQSFVFSLLLFDFAFALAVLVLLRALFSHIHRRVRP